MKLTIKITTGILATAMVVGGSWATQAVAQGATAIDNARSTAKSLQQQANATPAKPAPGAPAPAVKPAAIPGTKPVAAKPAASSDGSSNNQLRKVDVVAGAGGLQIQISSSQAVTPRVSKLKSPDRVVVELPETVVASAQNKIPVGSAGVKGVRIGMDGKTPPTTSVVVDLDAPLAYEMTSGADGKLLLTLHTTSAPSVAKSSPAPAAAPAKAAPVKTAPAAVASTKAPATSAPAPAAAVKTVAVKADPFKAAPVKAAALPVETKVAVAKAPAAPASKPEVAKLDPKEAVKAAVAAKTAAAAPDDAAKSAKADASKPKQEDKKWSLTGKRDPFFSPVVQTNGSGCSTGKKCLEINAINLRGVVKSDNGFIAVVTNSLNKAYFLRENDPVFNGYVVKITGDSVVFQETVQDKLGKPLTREVTKRIFTPAV